MNSEEEAEALKVAACTRTYDGRRYGIPGFGGTLGDLKAATERLAMIYEKILAARKR